MNFFRKNKVYLAGELMDNDNDIDIDNKDIILYNDAFNGNNVNIEYLNRMITYINDFYSVNDYIENIITQDCILLEIAILLPKNIAYNSKLVSAKSLFNVFYKIKENIVYIKNNNSGILWDLFNIDNTENIEEFPNEEKVINAINKLKKNDKSIINIYIDLIKKRRNTFQDESDLQFLIYKRFEHILISMVKISRHTYNSVKINGHFKLYGEKHRELDNINLGILKVGRRLISLINNPDDLSGTKKTEEIIINMEYYEDEKLYKLVEDLGKKIRLII
jgi:hypothetical protein